MNVKKVTYTPDDIEKNKDCALVLQGGSLRCLFTCGVLDYLMHKGVWFPYVNGVSAGSLCAISYISGQIGRTAKVNIDYVNDKRYLGLRNLLKGRSIFNFDFLFGEIADQLIPLDKEAFFSSPIKYTAVAVDCATGASAYFTKEDCSDIMLGARASSSLPLLARKVTVDSKVCLDGGVCEPVAYKKAFEDGYKKQVIVLTREYGYRKTPSSKPMLTAYHRAYREYPELITALEAMPDKYNSIISEIEQLEKDGKIFVIRPDKPVTINRLEKNTKKLKELYKDGIHAAKNSYEALTEYLKQ